MLNYIYYARINETFQGRCIHKRDVPANTIIMKYARPTSQHIARADGEWQLPASK